VPPSPESGASGDRITYVGHATVLIELAGLRLLTDPVLRQRVLHITRAVPPPAYEVGREIDAVLISHLHPDHLDFPSLRRIGRDIPVIAAAGSGRLLHRRGVRNVTELAPGELTRVGEAQVLAVRVEHPGGRYPLGRAIDALGFDVRAAGRRVFFAGDTDLFEEMYELAGDLDVALLPISGWGTRLGGPGHLDPRQAAQAAAMLRPRIAVPIHWGTLLRRGLERKRPELLTDPAREFVARVAELAPGVEARVLAPGESLDLT
jgi:L-ascorbate metabolism protein UlaG (beta-lactamase superfamily)